MRACGMGRDSVVSMVQLILAFSFGALGLVALLYGIVRLTQGDDRPLTPARRAWVLGGVAGAALFLLVLAWWAWMAPPASLSLLPSPGALAEGVPSVWFARISGCSNKSVRTGLQQLCASARATRRVHTKL